MGHFLPGNKKKEGKELARKLRSIWEDTGGIEIYAAGILQDIARERPLNDPYRTLRLLRESFIPMAPNLVELKAGTKADSVPATRFLRLTEAIEGGLPPLSEPVARRCAIIADDYLGNHEEFPPRAADVAWHFAVSSSNMLRGRVLSAAVRFMRPSRCLEAGTAYGLSGAIIASALQRVSPEGRLVTVEMGDIQYRLASALLGNLFGELVECRKGRTQEALAPAAASIAPVEFVFHDANHSGEAYVRDFAAILDSLAPGAVVIFDDIRWNQPLDPSIDPRCYEGWREVVASPRVERAVEIGGILGMLTVS